MLVPYDSAPVEDYGEVSVTGCARHLSDLHHDVSLRRR